MHVFPNGFSISYEILSDIYLRIKLLLSYDSSLLFDFTMIVKYMDMKKNNLSVTEQCNNLDNEKIQKLIYLGFIYKVQSNKVINYYLDVNIANVIPNIIHGFGIELEFEDVLVSIRDPRNKASLTRMYNIHNNLTESCTSTNPYRFQP